MMKKLLAVMLVLGMASLASAITFDISIGGNPTPNPDSGLILFPSDYLLLDIFCTSGFTPGEDGYVGLVAENTLGAMSGGVCLIPPAPDLSSVIGKFSELGWMPLGPTMDGIYGGVSSMNAADAGTYFDEILFHCEGSGDAVIQLYYTLDNETWELKDSVIIHQAVPEPMTMVLLGLGGLFLRRRKR